MKASTTGRIPPRWRLLAVGAALPLIDIGVLAIAYVAAVMMRFDGSPPATLMPLLIAAGIIGVVTRFTCLRLYGVQRFSWRHTSLHETVQIFAAMTLATIALILLDLVLRLTNVMQLPMLMPLGVLAADHILAFLALIGARATRRLIVDEARARAFGRADSGEGAVPTLLIGAGPAGVTVARELAARPDMQIRPLGFVDDDPRLVGRTVQGLPVLGTTRELPTIAASVFAEQAVITIASATGSEMRRVLERCNEAGLVTKIIPPVSEIVGGRVTLSRIRDVSVEDLLGREPITLDVDKIAAFVTNRVILVTGAGGSIGSELCRQIIRFNPSKVVLVEQAENNLFTILEELKQSVPPSLLVPAVADVCDESRMRNIMARFSASVVFHAAAHKHVPMMELNPGEAVKNNVGGTRVVARLAHDFDADYFVLVSTDKAVNPTSVMGATKRIAEMYCQALSNRSETKFITVRFGNVLGSSGSVIPTFRRQLASGGPLTVTHPEMRRYFMTIPEASQLVLQAASMGSGGEIFVLDMGEPVKVVDLARAVIRMAGFSPEDIGITFTGPRPGEKLYEELHFDIERASRTRHPKILIGEASLLDSRELDNDLMMLLDVATNAPEDALPTALAKFIPSYANQPHAPRFVERRNPKRPPTSTPLRRWDDIDATAPTSGS